MNTKKLFVMPLMLTCSIYQSEAFAQTNETTPIIWSSFNMGFAIPASAINTLASAVGQVFVGRMQQGDTRIESGFLASHMVSGPVTTVEEDRNEGIPSTYKLNQNYPNPFNPTTTIEFALPKSSPVTLKIFDMLGREMATLVDEELPAGVHKVVFDAKKLPTGVYFYRLQAEAFSQIRRLILLK